MRMMTFSDTDPYISLCDEINKWLEWLEQRPEDMKIFEIKQTALPPDGVIANPGELCFGERIEREPSLVITIWYGKATEMHLQKSLCPGQHGSAV